jgi:hypothetical protein
MSRRPVPKSAAEHAPFHRCRPAPPRRPVHCRPAPPAPGPPPSHSLRRQATAGLVPRRPVHSRPPAGVRRLPACSPGRQAHSRPRSPGVQSRPAPPDVKPTPGPAPGASPLLARSPGVQSRPAPPDVKPTPGPAPRRPDHCRPALPGGHPPPANCPVSIRPDSPVRLPFRPPVSPARRSHLGLWPTAPARVGQGDTTPIPGRGPAP